MSPVRTVWEEGRDTGPEVVALGAALALSAVSVDLLITDNLGVLFDLAFVAACVVLAFAVRPRDFFTVGVLPPLLMLSAFILVSIVEPGALARPGVSAIQAIVSGLSHHALALLIGYALCLGVLGIRQRVQHTRIV